MIQSPWHRTGDEPEPEPLPTEQQQHEGDKPRRIIMKEVRYVLDPGEAALDEITKAVTRVTDCERLIAEHLDRFERLNKQAKRITWVQALIMGLVFVLCLANLATRYL